MTAAKPTDEMNSWMGKFDQTLAPILPPPKAATAAPAAPDASKTAAPDGNKAAPGKLAGVQKALQKLGYDPGKIDGVMGPNTQAALKKFQQANGLKTDGILGPQTQAALAKALQGGASGAAPAAAQAKLPPAKTGGGDTASKPAAAASGGSKGTDASRLDTLEYEVKVLGLITSTNLAITNYFAKFNAGLSTFESRMNNAAQAEEEPDVFDVVGWKVFELVLSFGIPVVGGLIAKGMKDEAAKAAKEVAGAVEKIAGAAASVGHEVMKAKEKVKYGAWVADMRSWGGDQQKKITKTLDAAEEALTGFTGLVKAGGGGGNFAQLLFEATAKHFQDLQGQLKPVTQEDFHKDFSARFAATLSADDKGAPRKIGQVTMKDIPEWARGGDSADKIIKKGVDAGTLYFWIFVYRNSDTNNAWKDLGHGFTSERWKYVSGGSKKEIQGVADNLVAGAEGVPWDIECPKEVRLYLLDNFNIGFKTYGSRRVADMAQHSGKLKFGAKKGSPVAADDVRGEKSLLLAVWNDTRISGVVTGTKKIVGDTDT